jgi:phosphate transport system protein
MQCLRQPRCADSLAQGSSNRSYDGIEAGKIAKRTRRIAMEANAQSINIAEAKVSGEMASHILRSALDAFARMDTVAAAQIVRDDEAIDNAFRAFARKLVTYMMEVPRTIPTGLDYLSIAKAIERIGDHATNIAECVVYVVKGTDVLRHVPRDQLERDASGS